MSASTAARWLQLAVVGACWLGWRPSLAQEPANPVDLSWSAAPGCPERAAALAELRALLAHLPSSEPRPEARVTISRVDDGRFVVAMQTRLGQSVSGRRFAGVDCEALARASTLIIALALDPVGAASAAASTPVAARHATPPPLTASAPPPFTAVAPSLALALGLRVTGDAGSLPRPTLGGGVALDASYRRFLCELSATLWRSQEVSRGPAPGAGAVISLRTGSGRACLAPIKNMPSWYGCLGAEIGITAGRGVGIRHPLQSRDVWAAGLGGVAFRRKLFNRLLIWTSVDVAVPVRIPSYFIDGYGEVHRPWVAVPRGTIGFEVPFW